MLASPRCCALIVAAGSGSRLDPAVPKQFMPLGGRPLLAWTVEAFCRCPAVGSLVVVGAAEHLERTRTLLADIDPLRERDLPLLVCAGGTERSDSVWAGLQQLPSEASLVAVHDGARPLVTVEVIERTIAAAASGGAAIAGIDVADTIKFAHVTEGGTSVVRSTLARQQLRRAQTPQVFSIELLRAAYRRYREQPPIARRQMTDDAQVVEAFGDGRPVALVEGEADNIKITVPQDLRFAEALLAHRGMKPMPVQIQRSGLGYDVHRFDQRPGTLVLAGVKLPFSKTLIGHSDADVLCHAAADALLGAAALGDIGHHFPADDPRFEGACSINLLRRVGEMLADAGYGVGNLDCTVVCEAPRIAPHAQRMRENLAGALGVVPDRVSVKATTTEGLGFAGRTEGIAAYAVALIVGTARRNDCLS